MWNYVKEVNNAKQYFCDSCKKYASKMTLYPGYGNFILIKFNSQEEKMELLHYLESKNIFVRDTTQSSSVKNCFRITIGTVDQMKNVIWAIEKYYECL